MKHKKALLIGFMVLLIITMILAAGYIFIKEGRVEYSLLAMSALTVSTIIRYNRPQSRKVSKNGPSIGTIEKSYQEYLPNVFENKPALRKQMLKALQLYNTQDNEEAFQQLEQLLLHAENKYEKAALNFFMGLCADDDGIHDIAIHCYQSAIHFNPELHSVHSNLGLVYTKEKRYPEALNMLQKAIELTPDIIFPYINLADLYVKMKEGEKALEIAYKGLELERENVLCIQGIAMAYAVIGDREKCYENIKAMTNLGYQKSEVLTTLCNRILSNDLNLWN